MLFAVRTMILVEQTWKMKYYLDLAIWSGEPTMLPWCLTASLWTTPCSPTLGRTSLMYASAVKLLCAVESARVRKLKWSSWSENKLR